MQRTKLTKRCALVSLCVFLGGLLLAPIASADTYSTAGDDMANYTYYANTVAKMGHNDWTVSANTAKNGVLVTEKAADGTNKKVAYFYANETFHYGALSKPSSFGKLKGASGVTDPVKLETYYTYPDGRTFFYWPDGKRTWLYFGPDRFNIMVFVDGYPPMANPYARIKQACDQFDAQVKAVAKSAVYPTTGVNPPTTWLPPEGLATGSESSTNAGATGLDLGATTSTGTASTGTTTTTGTTTPATTTPATTTTPVTTTETAAGLVAYYRFDGNLTDSSGKGNNATGSVSYNTGVSATAKQCAVFKSSFLTVPASSSLNLGKEFTISYWMKMDPGEAEGNNREMQILYKNNHNPKDVYYDPFMIVADAWGVHSARIKLSQLDSGFEPFVETDGVHSMNWHQKWSLVTFVCTGPELFVYLDGKQNARASTGREYGKIFSDDIAGEYFIGGPDILYNGLLDELKIFNRALSASDIQAEYDRLTKPGATANPGSSNNAAGNAGGNSIILSIGNNKININGAQSQIDPSGGNVSPVVIDGRTLVPIRAIIVAMGGTISWNAAEQMATLALNGKEIKLWMNSTRGEVNGSPVTLDVPPRSINGRIFLPLRFVAENFGVIVEWEKATQKITLKY